MTLRRQQGTIWFQCDQHNSAKCEGGLQTNETEFGPAKDVLRASGWRPFAPRSAGGNWIHCCPRCTVPRG